METKRLPLEAIYFTPALYPRKRGVDYDLAARYLRAMEAGAQFPPIDLSATREVVDGAHRYLAYCHLQEKTGVPLEVEVIVHEVEDHEDILKLAIERNCAHGQSLTAEDLEFVVAGHPGLKGYLATLARFGFVMDVDDAEDLEFFGSSALEAMEEPEPPQAMQAAVADAPPRAATAPKRGRPATAERRAVQVDRSSPEPAAFGPDEEVFAIEEIPDLEPPKASVPDQPLIRALESLKLKGLLGGPAEGVARLMTVAEQKLMIECLADRLPVFARISGDVARLVREFIARNRDRGYAPKAMVEGILEMGPVADLLKVATEARPDQATDCFYTLRLRSASIRNQLIEMKGVSEAQKIKYLDWEMAEWMRLYLSMGGKARPHDFDTYPDLKELRTVEVEHGVF